jgi:hypothetical protein
LILLDNDCFKIDSIYKKSVSATIAIPMSSAPSTSLDLLSFDRICIFPELKDIFVSPKRRHRFLRKINPK